MTVKIEAYRSTVCDASVPPERARSIQWHYTDRRWHIGTVDVVTRCGIITARTAVYDNVRVNFTVEQ